MKQIFTGSKTNVISYRRPLCASHRVLLLSVPDRMICPFINLSRARYAVSLLNSVGVGGGKAEMKQKFIQELPAGFSF